MKPLLVWVLLCIIWGTTWIFIKQGLDDLPPIAFAQARFVLACAILLPFLLWKKIPAPKGAEIWKLLLVTGLLQFFINYGLVFWSEQHITSGLAAVLQATIPAFGLVLARIYIPDEKITLLKIISLVLGIMGVAVIFGEQLQINGVMAFYGCLAIVLGAAAAAYASVLTKAKALGMHPASIVFWQMLIGLVPLTITSLFTEGTPEKFNWSAKALVCVFYLATMGSIAAFWLYYWLLTKMDVTKAMMISFVTPLIAVIVGSFFGEKLELRTLIGGALILFSVFLIVVRPFLKGRDIEKVSN